MNYFEIATSKLVVSHQTTLTYQHDQDLKIGTIVRVPIGKTLATGIIVNRTKKPKFATKSIESVILTEVIPLELLQTMQWISNYYQTPLPQVVQTVLPAGLEKTRRDSKKPTAVAKRQQNDAPLTAEQQAALKKLADTTSTAILHGVTGSGKTRVYVERSKEVISVDQGVIVLVPEIGLTSQLVADFSASFNDVFVMHSNLTESERHKIWLKITKSKAPIVIGARSALFSPIKKLGLIIIDEEHESSYKQDKSPKYHAVRVASVLAKQHQAQLILGSATPSVEDYYLADQSAAPIIKMPRPINKSYVVNTQTIDLREKKNFKKGSYIFSDVLIEAISGSLQKSKQILLFHNRRGSATSVVCTNCGYLASCPTCHIPLTHHHDIAKLICHVCNFNQSAPVFCPECKQPTLLYKGIGTKQIVEEAKKHFPSAQIARFDSDTKPGQQLAKRYQELYDGKVDIIVGTQMVAKGLDLPHLETVGVVLADTTLYLPDFSANERAFQLLYQVIGRVGRHNQSSEVIVQSYAPDHPAIDHALRRDYKSFYESEIADRQLIKYPPFRFLLQLVVERKSKDAVVKAADKFASVIRSDYPSVEVLGPSPAFYERSRSGYRWQIVVKSKSRAELVKIVKESLPAKWQFTLDPINLL